MCRKEKVLQVTKTKRKRARRRCHRMHQRQRPQQDLVPRTMTTTTTTMMKIRCASVTVILDLFHSLFVYTNIGHIDVKYIVLFIALHAINRTIYLICIPMICIYE